MNDKELFAKFHGIDIETALSLIRNNDCRCKCGDFKTLKQWGTKGLRMYGSCGKSKCHWHYGNKRPEHSATMKDKAINGSDEYKSTLMKKGENFNKEVNTVSFLRKKLITYGYNVDNLTDDEIIKLNSISESTRTKSLTHKIKATVTRYNSWETIYKELCHFISGGVPITEEYMNSLTNEEALFVFRRIHGINTIRNWDSVQETRKTWFKRERVGNLLYNTQGKASVVTKSGMEAKYILLFESCGWKWSYESVVINNTSNDGFHVPDFIVEINGTRYMIETKGNFYRQPVEEYLENKVKAAIKYCDEHNLIYILTDVNKPKSDLMFIENALINTGK